MKKYYMGRVGTPLILNFEFTCGLMVFLATVVLYVIGSDRRSVWVFAVSAGMHSVLEILATALGARRFHNPQLFGVSMRFPAPSLIVGMFEGGLVSLAAFQFLMWMAFADTSALKFFLILCAVFGLLSVLGALRIAQQRKRNALSGEDYTRRTIFSRGSVVLLAVFFGLGGLFLLLTGEAASAIRWSFLWYYLGIIGFLLVLMVPFHLFRIRVIEVEQGGVFQPAKLSEQLLVMYGYNVAVEAGWYVCHFIVLYWAGVLPLSAGASMSS